MKTLIDKQIMIEEYYAKLQNEIYGYRHCNKGNIPEGIIMHYNTCKYMIYSPSINAHQTTGPLNFMGIKVIRTYDIEEGEFLIF